jgi:hypothetical protein
MNIKTACTGTDAAYNAAFSAEISTIIITICLIESTAMFFVCESSDLQLLANLCAWNIRIIFVCAKPYNIMEHNCIEQHNTELNQH